MNAAVLRGAIESWVPTAGVRGVEAVVVVSPPQFKESFSLGATSILETLGLADLGKTFGERGIQTWEEYVVAVDEASFHGGMAVVFLRQVLELGKERVPVQASDPRAFTWPEVDIGTWNVQFDTPDNRREEAVARGFELARRYFHLREQLDRVAGWEGFSNWAIAFLHCTGTLLGLAAEVCAYQWASAVPHPG